MNAIDRWQDFLTMQGAFLKLLNEPETDLALIRQQVTELDSMLAALPQTAPANCPADVIAAVTPLIDQANSQNQAITKGLQALRMRELTTSHSENSRDQRLKQTLYAYGKTPAVNPRFIDRHR